MGHNKQFLKLSVFGILALVMAVLAALVYGQPNNLIGVYAFKVGYFASIDKADYLRLYSPQRRGVAAGYLPPDVDAFLCNRIEMTNSDAELSAIVELYVLQAAGREGTCIYKTSSPTAEKIAQHLVSSITTSANDRDIRAEIILLEEVRRGANLGKGKLGTSSTATDRPSTSDEWQQWAHSTAFPTARTRYGDWWNLELPWEEKRTISPLKDSGVQVYECCG